jgi:acyl-CoA reductase-like NAD-dependent aldehyde dehydrogenase
MNTKDTMPRDCQMSARHDTYAVINPANEEIITHCPECSPERLDEVVEDASQAFLAWRKDEALRRQLLVRCAEVIRANAASIAKILTAEQGKPYKDALGEVHFSAWWMKNTATLSIPTDVLQDDEEGYIEIRRVPLGVVAGIEPWNFPIAVATWTIAPALLVGDTVIVKPSPYTPLSTLRLGELLKDILPHGVLTIISGGNETGEQLTRHPAIRKIAFTGSIPTGKKVAASAAPDLKRMVLELGGNDPAIVMEDVDPVKTAKDLFWGAFSNNGQVCIAIKRLYVHEKVYSSLIQEMAEIARSVKVGNGMDPETQLGPVNNPMQLMRVIELVEDAKRAGGRIVTGGHRFDGPGYFYPPTIVADISNGVRLVDEEQFGPALPVIPFTDLDDVIKRANATHFGLGGSVWTNDLNRGMEVARQIESGTCWVNQHANINPRAPFGGMKWSGIGRQMGRWDIDSYCDLQSINATRKGQRT